MYITTPLTNTFPPTHRWHDASSYHRRSRGLTLKSFRGNDDDNATVCHEGNDGESHESTGLFFRQRMLCMPNRDMLEGDC